MKKLIAIALLALGLGAGFSASFVDPALAGGGGTRAPSSGN